MNGWVANGLMDWWKGGWLRGVEVWVSGWVLGGWMERWMGMWLGLGSVDDEWVVGWMGVW